MTYEELKTAKRDLQAKVSKLQRDRGTLATAVDSISSDIKTREDNIPVFVQEERNKKLNEKLHEIQAPFLDKISSIGSEIERLKTLYQEEVKNNSLESILAGIVAESPLSAETKSRIDEIKALAYEATSVRFVDAYYDYLPKMVVNEDDFLEALDSVEGLSESFARQEQNFFFTFMTNVTRKAKSINLNLGEDKKKNASILTAAGVLGLITSAIALPVYMILLTGVSLTNSLHSVKLRESLIILKTVEDNYSRMHNALQKRAIEQHGSIMDDLNKDFNDLYEEYDQEQSDLKHQMSEELIKARKDFEGTFDDKEIKAQLQAIIINMRAQLTEDQKRIHTINESITNLEKQIQDIEQQMLQCADDLRNEYLSYKVGTSLLFPKRFLFDIVNSKPVFYEYSGQSVLFRYTDRKMMLEFIKLLVVQMRCQMIASALHVEVWDLMSAGASMQAFSPTDVKKAGTMFSPLSSQQAFNDSLKDLSDVFKKRISVVRRDFTNITDYNEFMISQESLPESYKVIFIQDTEAVGDKPELIQLLREGASVGIYIFLFLHKDHADDKLINLVQNVDAIIDLTEGRRGMEDAGFEPRAKGFVIEDMSGRK